MEKIVILHTEESNGWAGQEIRILGEMLGMKRRGHELLLAAPPGAKILARASSAGIETFPIRMEKKRTFRAVLEVSRIIKDMRVTIVNTHSSRDSWIGSVAGRLCGAKVVRTRHISSPFSRNPFTRLVYGPLCDAVMTTGEFIKDQIVRELGLDPAKIYTVPTGIDVERFAAADGTAVRKELGIGRGVPVVGMAAALRSWKGHEFLLRAFARVLDDFPGALLVLAGEGPYRAKVEGWVNDLGLGSGVIMLGHRDDVPEVIKAFDVAALSSYASEGIPQFVLQAMAAGRPVIGTAVGGIPEVVKDGANGLLVPPRDPDSLASAIVRLLAEPDTRERMGREGLRMAREGHTEDRMLDAVEQVYSKVLAGKLPREPLRA